MVTIFLVISSATRIKTGIVFRFDLTTVTPVLVGETNIDAFNNLCVNKRHLYIRLHAKLRETTKDD